jgi:hypothetical protein
MFEIIEPVNMPAEVREIYDTLESKKENHKEYIEYLFDLGKRYGILFESDRAWYFNFTTAERKYGLR